jgi:AAT family amino acid transporter
VDDSLGFALTWNYWFNDAVSTAADLLALQILFEYWTKNFPGWGISLVFLLLVLAFNLAPVKVFGEVSKLSKTPNCLRGASLITLVGFLLVKLT